MNENTTATICLTLNVKYALNGVNPQDMQVLLRQQLKSAICSDLLTGDTAAEVESFELDTRVSKPMPDEDEIAEFLQEQIEGGHIDAEGLATRMTRYGLARPEDFADEMRECIEMANGA